MTIQVEEQFEAMVGRITIAVCRKRRSTFRFLSRDHLVVSVKFRVSVAAVRNAVVRMYGGATASR